MSSSSGPLSLFSTGSLTLKDLDREFTPASNDASAILTAKQKVEKSQRKKSKQSPLFST